FFPGDLFLARIGFLDGRVEHADGRPPDVGARAVAFDEGDDGLVRHVELAGGNRDRFTLHGVAPKREIRENREGRLWGFRRKAQNTRATNLFSPRDVQLKTSAAVGYISARGYFNG